MEVERKEEAEAKVDQDMEEDDIVEDVEDEDDDESKESKEEKKALKRKLEEQTEAAYNGLKNKDKGKDKESGSVRPAKRARYDNFYEAIDELDSMSECYSCRLDMCCQIFQCAKGHNICEDCFPKVSSKCPVCRDTSLAFKIRNLALEQLLARRKELPCRYQENGCNEILTGANKRAHEMSCDKKPFPCKWCKYGNLNEADQKEHELHCEKQPMECMMSDCKFSTSTLDEWEKHMLNEHKVPCPEFNYSDHCRFSIPMAQFTEAKAFYNCPKLFRLRDHRVVFSFRMDTQQSTNPCEQPVSLDFTMVSNKKTLALGTGYVTYSITLRDSERKKAMRSISGRMPSIRDRSPGVFRQPNSGSTDKMKFDSGSMALSRAMLDDYIVNGNLVMEIDMYAY